MKVTWYTTAPSPHLVGLLDSVSEHPQMELQVVYLYEHFGERAWSAPAGRAPHRFLIGGPTTSTVGRLRCCAAIAGIQQRDETDIAVVALSYMDPAAHLLSQRLRQATIPWVFYGEPPSVFSSRGRQWLRDMCIRKFLRSANGLIGVSERTCSRYSDHWGFKGPSTWAPYHRELSQFLRLPRRVPGEVVRFLVVGDLIPRKAPETALAAYSRLNGATELHFVGDGPLKATLRKAIGDSGAKGVSLKGRIGYGQIGEVMNSADVLVFPSRHDGFGMVTMEALAAGLPVIGSNRAMSVLQYIRPGHNGWIFPADDVDSLTTSMQYVVDNRQRLPEWSQAARDSLKEYDPRQDAERVVSFLQEVIDSSTDSRNQNSLGA